MNLLNGKSLEELIDIDIRTIDQDGGEDCKRIQKELEKSPNDPEVWFNLGMAYVDSAVTRHFLMCRKAEIDAANAARKAEEEALAKAEEAEGEEDNEFTGSEEAAEESVSEIDDVADKEDDAPFSSEEDDSIADSSCREGNCGCGGGTPDFLDIDPVEARPFCEKAIECFQHTLQLEPEYYGVQCQMGVTYVYMKEYVLAQECFKKAVEEDEEDFSAIYYLGQTYHAMGNEAMAKHYFELAEEQQRRIEDLEQI